MEDFYLKNTVYKGTIFLLVLTIMSILSIEEFIITLAIVIITHVFS